MENPDDIKDIVAQNLITLRKANKITQLELAEKLNYSDKAISKWERGESIPDVITLKQLADMYGVTVDYILNEQTEETIAKYRMPRFELNNKLIITILACLSIWTLAAIAYINLVINTGHHYWIIWIWTLPITSIVLITFASIWGNKNHIIAGTSLLIWTSLLSFYIHMIKYNLWSLFLLGIPTQIIAILCGKLKRRKIKQIIIEQEA